MEELKKFIEQAFKGHPKFKIQFKDIVDESEESKESESIPINIVSDRDP